MSYASCNSSCTKHNFNLAELYINLIVIIYFDTLATILWSTESSDLSKKNLGKPPHCIHCVCAPSINIFTISACNSYAQILAILNKILKHQRGTSLKEKYD